ncbi:MAG: CHASE3 domain-containing protein [Cyclobacteriaceae bacterium]|nr:CHASE3 domain-containing protein [Cyclobacteriaceae bacterium]
MASTKPRLPLLVAVVSIISILLAVNAVLIYENSRSIARNQRLLENAEQAKINSLDVIRNIHLMDLALRGYALTGQEAQLAATDSALVNHPKIFDRLRKALAAQNFQKLDELDNLEDSVTAYFKLTVKMRHLVAANRNAEFLEILKRNEGFYAWQAYKNFSDRVTAFETQVVTEAEANIQRTLRNSYLLQFFIFLIAVPALGYLAFHTARTFRLSEELQYAQVEKNKILLEKNEELDRQVQEKTRDIRKQNEEIRAHNRQLLAQQEQIKLATETIEAQAFKIAIQNKQLAHEVERQTNDLRQTNNELMEQNSRLQQFTYIISHNLRAPLARLKGLANLLEYSETNTEKDNIYKLLIKSSRDIDDVITDLSTILNIQKQTMLLRSEILLSHVIHKVLSTLEVEIKEVQPTIKIQLNADTLFSVSPYVESIFYNLVANAIKYHNPQQPLEIIITSQEVGHYIQVVIEDNGLGFDLAKHRHNLFNLYKRFHTHVEGKGLGLYLAKTQMEALGGKIEVDSEENKGTRFILYFNVSV